MKEIEDPPTEEQQKQIKDITICRRTWEVMTEGYMPDLHTARTIDEDFLRLFRYAPSAWIHGAVPFREDLIHLSARWSNQLALPGSCPYQPTSDEPECHKTLWEDYVGMRKMKNELVRGLGTDEDGWVPIDRWEEVRKAHSLLFGQWLETAAQTDRMTNEEARTIWPFDPS